VSELLVILSCFGRTDDDFVSCSGCNNVIFRFDSSHHFYDEMMEYLDSLQLFDKPLLDINAVRHFIFNMQDRFILPGRKLWSEKMFYLYQKFAIDHKDCGLRLQLKIV